MVVKVHLNHVLFTFLLSLSSINYIINMLSRINFQSKHVILFYVWISITLPWTWLLFTYEISIEMIVIFSLHQFCGQSIGKSIKLKLTTDCHHNSFREKSKKKTSFSIAKSKRIDPCSQVLCEFDPKLLFFYYLIWKSPLFHIILPISFVCRRKKKVNILFTWFKIPFHMIFKLKKTNPHRHTIETL